MPMRMDALDRAEQQPIPASPPALTRPTR